MLAARSTATAGIKSAFLRSTCAAYATTGKANPFGEHESAVENMYFNKEDERALLKLLSKVKQVSGTTVDTAHSVAAEAAEEAKLRSILGKYNVSKEDYAKLMAWKHEHF